MILFIIELFANVICFCFYIEPSSGHLKMWCYIFWILFQLIFFICWMKRKKKHEEVLNGFYIP